MNKKQCFCGCQSFYVYQFDGRKGDIMIQCQACKCERRINSPGISAEQYHLSPVLVNVEVAKVEP
jgi:hypothetical protein